MIFVSLESFSLESKGQGVKDSCFNICDREQVRMILDPINKVMERCSINMAI
jgi:hypothetical protein